MHPPIDGLQCPNIAGDAVELGGVGNEKINLPRVNVRFAFLQSVQNIKACIDFIVGDTDRGLIGAFFRIQLIYTGYLHLGISCLERLVILVCDLGFFRLCREQRQLVTDR